MTGTQQPKKLSPPRKDFWAKMMLQNTKAASSLQNNLDELRREAELESLRPFVKEACCFMPQANADTAPIGMDELKKLARSWKLHERRNFWKNHPDVVSLVNVLLQFIEDTNRWTRESKKESAIAPTPPSESKSSRNNKTRTTGSKMRQIYGLNYFNREVTDKELALNSRFFSFPLTAHDNAKALEVEVQSQQTQEMWTTSRKDRIKTEMKMISLLQGGVSRESVAAKKAKHLNLAQHLVTFSSSEKCDKDGMPPSAIQTFVSVSDTTDPKTASCALIALCNIASMSHVREYMVENNMMHKVANIIPYSRGPTAAIATGRLFYYFSCDAEVEDRIYNAGGQFIAANGNSEDRELQILTLKTLANLMPCGDRLRVTETVMKIVHIFVQAGVDPSDYDTDTFDREMALAYLPLLLSISSFTNTHSTLLAADVFDLLVKVTLYSIAESDSEVAILVSKILLSFMQLQDHHVTHQIAHEDNYIYAFEKLLEIHNEEVLENCMHAICIMSGVSEMADAVSDSEISGVISHTIFSWESFPKVVCVDAATYYSNACQHFNKEYLRSLVVDDKMALSIMALIGKSADNFKAQQIAIRALQNLLTVPATCAELCNSVLPTLMHFTEIHHDLGAAQSIYNISCATECVRDLKDHQVHKKVLSYYISAKDLDVREVYLQIICQMFHEPSVIDEMLAAGMVERLSETVTGPETAAMWPVVVKIALNTVDHCKQTITERQRVQIVGLLKVICVKSSADEIIGKASVVLAYLSLTLEDFSEVDSVLRGILQLSNSDLVTESVSIILYNLTCSEKNTSILLKDSMYIQIMINIMRNGRPNTQINIAKAMRTLCSKEECINLLMKGPSLSDLIVIALLRSSSIEIKVVCSQAFYNMLTHFEPREKLLKGDLWWAITRICRNDSMDIRVSAAKALLDLSIDTENANSLREHHVFSFLQELSVGADINFVNILMKAAQNLCDEFEGSFQPYEFICLVKLCVDAIARCTNVDTVRSAVVIMVNIAVQKVPGWDQSFIEDAELLDALKASMQIWGQDSQSRHLVSALLWNMSSSAAICKSFHLENLNDIMSAIYVDEPSSGTNEYLLGTLVNYVTVPAMENSASKSDILDITICNDLIFDAFGVGKNNFEVTLSGRTFAVTVMAYVVDAMDLSSLTSPIVRGIVTSEHVHEPSIKENLMVVIHVLSKSSAAANYLLDASLFSTLYKLCTELKTTNEAIIKYISCCIRNISSHADLVPRVVRTMELDKLVRYLLDVTQTEEVCLDVALMMFYAHEYKLCNDFIINSEFCLEICSKVMEVWKGDHRIAKLCKYVIGEILEKFSDGIFVDPTFVQSMYAEMTTTNFKEIRDYVHNLEVRGLKLDCIFNIAIVVTKEGTEYKYYLTTAASDQWKPFLVQERKRMVTYMLDKSIIVPLMNKNTIVTVKRGSDGWTKIEEIYNRMSLPSNEEFETHFAFIEENEEDEDEDEEQEEKEEEVEGKGEEGDPVNKGDDKGKSELGDADGDEEKKSHK